MRDLRIHRYAASATPVNAYFVETRRAVVIVDTTLTVSDGRAPRSLVGDIGKPLEAIPVTHAHPDHYRGAAEIISDGQVAFLAVEGGDAVIRRDDELKEQIIRPMFGDEWPHERAFPNQTINDGETPLFDGVPFTLIDLGPDESPRDSIWLVGDDRKLAFAGGSAYEHMHCYLANGFWESWLANIARLRSELPAAAEVHFGHGEPTGSPQFDWQEDYIATFVDATRTADWSDPESAKAAVVKTMTDYLPAGDLEFLMELSVEPVARQLALIGAG